MSTTSPVTTPFGVALAGAIFLCTGLLPVAASAARLAIGQETAITWTPVSGRTYQVQWSPSPGNGPWTDLGPPMVGEGGSRVVFDADGGGARTYRVLEGAPGGGESLVDAIAGDNPGFESGSSGWTLGSTQSITTSDAHTGQASLRNHIPQPATGALLVKKIPSIVPGAEHTLSFRAKQVEAGPAYVQHYKVEWIGSGGGVTIATGGWVDFTGGTDGWTRIASPPLAAPAGATAAQLTFYFATGAIEGSRGEVLLDDVAFEYPSTTPAPAQFVGIPSTTRPAIRLEWPSIDGVTYHVEENPSLDPAGWRVVAPPFVGDGSPVVHRAAADGARRFYRISRPILAPEAPSNLRVLAGGSPGSVTLAWDASISPGVVGYRVLYGTSDLELSMDVGPVQSVTLTDLPAGESLHFTVVSLSEDGAGPSGPVTLTASPAGAMEFQPLFTADTLLQPDPVVETPTALVTRLADRARDRHAREGIGFLVSDGPAKSAAFKYDHYLPFYWEQRVAQIEIVDEVAKGGDKLVFNFTTQARLNPAEFRTFFNVGSPLSGYHNNQSDNLNAGVVLVSSGPSSRYPGETDHNYTATVAGKMPENRPLRIGDRVEVELSQFLLDPRNGRNNYYGTAFLYIVGFGVVPWYAKEWEEAENKVVGVTSFDSHPLPQEAWLGGLTTLPYQYSNEPQHRFKQMAGNITPENGQPFMLGRRLHHTDFLTGEHSEPGNPVFTSHSGKAGPGFVARSCVACHVNNGRSLLPAPGLELEQAVVKVGSTADGAADPLLGEQLQPRSTSGTAEPGAVISHFIETTGSYGDGTPYTLRKPVLSFTGGPAPAFHSLRVAPPLVGLGLLEAVPETAILALADPADADGDGISGRANMVPDPSDPSIQRLGRFTPKASHATVLHQIAYALNRDMGVTSNLFPILDGESLPRPAEIGDDELDLMNRYVALLGVGAQRNLHDPLVSRGRQLFASASCVKCHTPTLATGPHHPMGELRNQTIHPYTDLLLHDMGPGLADTMAGEGASASEWRTAPLWNIGLSAGVSDGSGYLHDGRARTIEEAILWHGGEAEQARENFRTMSASDRAAILAFIESL